MTLSPCLRELAPAIIQRWDDLVRAEVPGSAEQEKIILRDHVELMLEVVSRMLSGEADPKRAARDLAYITIHADQRVFHSVYSLEEMVREWQILHEVVLEYLGSRQALCIHERIILSHYFNELTRIAAGEFARIQASRLADVNQEKDEFLAMLADKLRDHSSLFEFVDGASHFQSGRASGGGPRYCVPLSGIYDADGERPIRRVPYRRR